MDKKIHITVVDDEPAVGIIYEAMLKSEIQSNCYEFQFFTSAKDYLEYLEGTEICEKTSILVSDINMPEIDGFELLGKIVEKYPKMDKYISSAISSKEYREKGENLEVMGYFDKPVDFREVRKIFSKKYEDL